MSKVMTMGSAIVIDGRGLDREQVGKLAENYMPRAQEDSGPNPGDHGFYFAPQHRYHVGSVCRGIFIVSRKEMSTEETQEMARKACKEWGIETNDS